MHIFWQALSGLYLEYQPSQHRTMLSRLKFVKLATKCQRFFASSVFFSFYTGMTLRIRSPFITYIQYNFKISIFLKYFHMKVYIFWKPDKLSIQWYNFHFKINFRLGVKNYQPSFYQRFLKIVQVPSFLLMIFTWFDPVFHGNNILLFCLKQMQWENIMQIYML